MLNELEKDSRYNKASLGGQDITASIADAYPQIHTPVHGHLWQAGKGQSGQPKILILPGFTEFCEKYAHIARHLHDEGFDSLTIDWPGQGRSGRYGTHPLAVHVDDFKTHIAALDALIEAAGWQQEPFHILAHSMGGHLALLAAHHFGKQVKSLVLSAPMIVPVPKPVWFIKLLARGLKAAGLARAHVPFTGIPELEEAGTFNPHNQLTTSPAGFAWQTAWFADQPDLRRYGATVGWVAAAYKSASLTSLNPSFLSQISQPCLIMGAEDETIVSLDAIKFASRHLPQADYVEIAKARHELFNETPDIYKQVWGHISDFWKRQNLG